MLNTFGEDIIEEVVISQPPPPPPVIPSARTNLPSARTNLTNLPLVRKPSPRSKFSFKSLIKYLKDHLELEDKHWDFYANNEKLNEEDLINSNYHRGKIDFLTTLLFELNVPYEDFEHLTPNYQLDFDQEFTLPLTE